MNMCNIDILLSFVNIFNDEDTAPYRHCNLLGATVIDI